MWIVGFFSRMLTTLSIFVLGRRPQSSYSLWPAGGRIEHLAGTLSRRFHRTIPCVSHALGWEEEENGERGVCCRDGYGGGKTLVSAALARRLVRLGCAVGVMKLVETGVSSGTPDQSDAARLIAAARVDDSLGLVSPYRFSLPLAPFAAASSQGQVIEFDTSLEPLRATAARHACVVVEGAGGLLVPMGHQWDLGT